MLMLVCLHMVAIVLADDAVIHLFSTCPSTDIATPTLHFTTDVPAYALARCRNGDKELVTIDTMNYALDGSFAENYVGEKCLFHKKKGIRTYVLDVEFGLGERNAEIADQKKIHTVSCAYDALGKVISKTEKVAPWFMNPWEKQTFLGANATGTLDLKVEDLLGNEVTTAPISIGRKVRLIAYDYSGRLSAFKAVNCYGQNPKSKYFILSGGCGDGMVIPAKSGFKTEGNTIYSPWFQAFKLSGDDKTVRFSCTFTTCNRLCNGDSCSKGGKSVGKQKRSVNSVNDDLKLEAKSKIFKYR